MKALLLLLAISSSPSFALGLGTTVCHEIGQEPESSHTYLITEKEESFTFEKQLNHKTLEKAEISRENITFENGAKLFFSFENQESDCSEELTVTLITNEKRQGDLSIKSSKTPSVVSSVECRFHALDDGWVEPYNPENN